MKVRSPFAVALVVGALLLGAACSSSGGDDAAPESSTTTSADDTGATDTTTDETAPTNGSSTDDDPSGGADVDAYVEALEESVRTNGGMITAEQASCYAPRLIEVLDAERLADAGVTPDELAESDDLEFPDVDLDEDEANEVYDIYEDCGLDIRSIFIEGVLLGSDLDDDEIACIESVVTDDKIRALMVGMIVVGEEEVDSIPEVAAFGEEVQDCLSD